MVSRLDLVLRELNENGNFRASLFSTSTGLVLASQKAEDVDERVVAAMGTLLSDAAISAGKEMNLSEAQVMKIFYKKDYIICRTIFMPDGKTQFLLAVLSKSCKISSNSALFGISLSNFFLFTIKNSQNRLPFEIQLFSMTFIFSLK